MKNLLYKELKLASSPLSFVFILFATMAMIPGYPILLGSFFLCFGLFQSFQLYRESNDILYTALLPLKKSDTVKAKYIVTVFIQMIGFAIMFALTLVRMNFLYDAEAYTQNPLMNANPFFLGLALVIMASFNWFFIRGFFKTAYKIGFPFLGFGIATTVIVGIGETVHHIPGLEYFNETSVNCQPVLWLTLAAGAAIYIIVTFAALKSAQKRFEKIDL